MANEQLTPMMRQFRKIKEQYPDALLLFRCGDFYETYAEDAVRAAKILNITLTKRNNGGGAVDSTAMAGFPFHALDTYLPKLVRAGLRVAICDQLEDPKLAKGLVQRGVTELVTPGASYNDASFGQKENNWLCCLHFAKVAIGISLLDLSTGEFLVAQGTSDYIGTLLAKFAPKEVLFVRGKRQEFEHLFSTKYFTYELEDWMLNPSTAEERLRKQFETTNLKGFGVSGVPEGVVAAAGILHYLDITQHLQTKHIHPLSRLETDKYVWLDQFTIRNLELMHHQTDESRSLVDVLDKTITPMGGRMLRRWITFPLKDVRPIRNRQMVVEYFFRHPDERENIRENLSLLQDMERTVSKISTGRIGPRELVQLGQALGALQPIKAICEAAEENPYLNNMGEAIELCAEMRERIRRQIVPEPPLAQGRPNTIASGVDDELDELRDLRDHSREAIERICQREIERTGINSLKVGYNNVFGYYLEVRNTFKDSVPPEWIRKQTLVSAERYITPELKALEEKIVAADDRIAVIETRVYNELVLALVEYVPAMQIDANVAAQLDCLQGFANAAAENKYICPDVNDSLVIDIRQGRHPVIERQMPLGEEYIANDVLVDNNGQQIIIITGPNMAGKSALLRQTALIVLMAQMGSFVPAESAAIGIVDKIFTRVGASDNISQGESTFMVEMNEAASILNNLSERSLVLFDELGRGTSTYDGISIAWAIIEYIHEHPGHAKTLFATHYHELNEMEASFPRIRNYNVSVREVNNKVIFLRKLVRGGSEHSFGIHVAKIAGMPESIIQRANTILKQLENDAVGVNSSQQAADSNKHGVPSSKPVTNIGQTREGLQLSFFQLDDPVLEQIRDELKSLDINSLTPLEALNKLSEISALVGNKTK
ncbi:MAG: DNA mismatch repair protein MutS [Paludibacteraceae bacterium]|nr:DNA mismatch repair protein MutS [Paludibacteraceae bacterium]